LAHATHSSHIARCKPNLVSACYFHVTSRYEKLAEKLKLGVVDADAMLAVVVNEQLQPIAREAAERLQRVIEAV
jgi:hypothetical protein